jgi:hypothetical protein
VYTIGEVSSNTRVVQTEASTVASGHLPRGTIVSGVLDPAFFWDDLAYDELDCLSTTANECEIAMREDVDKVVRQNRNSAKERGEQVSNKNEARAITTLTRASRGTPSVSY